MKAMRVITKGVHTRGVSSQILGIELAIRYQRGELLDVSRLRREYKISRATAYRWLRMLNEVSQRLMTAAEQTKP